MFGLQGQEPVCLLCYEAVSVNKEYNLHGPFDTKHTKVSLLEKQRILQESKGKLRCLSKGTVKNTTAVKASFFVAEDIVRALLQKSLFESVFAEGL